MGKTLGEIGPKTHVAEVEHHGEKLIVPATMSLDEAADLLIRRKKYMHTEVNISETFSVYPFDGAYALSQVIIRKFGWAEGKAIKSFFGNNPPQIFRIATSPTDRVDVPWGHFNLPGVKGTVETGVSRNNHGQLNFQVSAVVLREDEATIRDLFSLLREYLKTHSLYRGKAIKLRFRDDEGETLAMPEPEFINVEDMKPENLILNQDLMASVQANLFTPITRVRDCIANNIKVKRGVLLGGPYGTGKTLAATVAAKLAQDAGITYVYTPRAAELADAIAFAKQYQSPACVVFCEDIDREVTGQRTVKMDDVLNILDGIDTKSENIITVLTTNHLDNVNQAMLRPGRLDAIINIERPDAEAAERLVRYYGGDAIDAHEDLTEVGKTLAGQIPAVIEEAVKRAKLFQLTLSDKGSAVTGITAEALRQSAVTMRTQIDLLADKAVVEVPTLDQAMGNLVGGALKDNLKTNLVKAVKEVANA